MCYVRYVAGSDEGIGGHQIKGVDLLELGVQRGRNLGLTAAKVSHHRLPRIGPQVVNEDVDRVLGPALHLGPESFVILLE